MERIDTQCVIAGGGPAGIMAGLMFARAGVDVTVLEKHADFFRDFRGDTVHPSTLELLHELGCLDGFLTSVPHDKTRSATAWFGDDRIHLVDFDRLPVAAPYIAMAPQWDFLNFLTDQAKAYPGFDLRLATTAEELIVEDGSIVGVKARSGDSDLEIRAELTIAADGRNSTLRPCSELIVRDLGAPIDVLWFRVARKASDGTELNGRFRRGAILIAINRQDYWQCAFVIPKGSFDAVKARGLPDFQARAGALMPFENGAERMAEIDDWDRVKLLTVKVDRLTKWWRPGLMVIGDAAHAMSPIGGVGVNLAVQDAVATANILALKLRAGTLTDADLEAVEKRRLWPTNVTQFLQVQAQNRILSTTLAAEERLRAPWPLRMATKSRFFRSLLGRLIGLGVRPEHVEPLPANTAGTDGRSESAS